MKRILVLLLVILFVFMLPACQNQSSGTNSGNKQELTVSNSEKEENESSKTESVSNSESESSAPEIEMTTAVQISGDEQTGELPEIEGPERFVELFLKNPIDEYYLNEMETAASVSMMLNVTNNSMKYWEAEVNSVYSELMIELGEDSEAFKKIKVEQNAFSNDLVVATNEIREEAEKNVTGSMVNIEISYRLMLLYRGRAVELLCSLYNITGEVNVTLLGDAAG